MILQRAELEYMQTYWEPEGFDLEYRDGGPEAHFVSAKKLALNEVRAAFKEYLAGCDDWRARHEFELLEFE